MLTLKELSDTYNENHPNHAHLLNHADVTNKELNVTKRKNTPAIPRRTEAQWPYHYLQREIRRVCFN